MTWFLKATVFCTTVLLLGFTWDVLGYTLYMCQQDCKDEPDDPVCSRWNFTTDDRPPRNVSDYKWLKNECERKCFSHGRFERVADMELCTKNGQTRTTYICSDLYFTPHAIKRCMRNETRKQSQ